MYVLADNSRSEFDRYNEPALHMERLLKARLVEFTLPLNLLIHLEAINVRTLGDLVKKRAADLLKARRIGPISVRLLERLLFRYGLHMAM